MLSYARWQIDKGISSEGLSGNALWSDEFVVFGSCTNAKRMQMIVSKIKNTMEKEIKREENLPIVCQYRMFRTCI